MMLISKQIELDGFTAYFTSAAVIENEVDVSVAIQAEYTKHPATDRSFSPKIFTIGRHGYYI